MFLILITVFLCHRYRNRRKPGHSYTVSRSFTSAFSSRTDLEKSDLYYGLPIFDYNELQEATNNFNPQKELGEGGFGTVFHGKVSFWQFYLNIRRKSVGIIEGFVLSLIYSCRKTSRWAFSCSEALVREQLQEGRAVHE